MSIDAPNETEGPSDLTELTAVADIFSVLGGVRAVMSLTEAKSPQVVNNWKAEGRIAAHTYLLFVAALKAEGYWARPALWGISQPMLGEAVLSVPLSNGQ